MLTSLIGTIASVVGALLALYSLRSAWAWRQDRHVIIAIALLCLSLLILLVSSLEVSAGDRLLQVSGFALAVMAGYFLALWNQRRKLLVFGPNFRAGGYIPGYYSFMEKAINEAKEEIIITGSGFDFSPGAGHSNAQRILVALESALARGVRVIRLQSSRKTSDDWLDALKALKKKHSEKFLLFASIHEREDLADVMVIDPAHQRSCVVESALSTRSSSGAMSADRVSVSLAVRGDQLLARHLSAKIEGLCREQGEAVDDIDQFDEIFRGVYYFSFGSNMASEQMSRRCKSAQFVDTAYALDYEMTFNVYSYRWRCYVANLCSSESAKTPGVLWRISRRDLASLDEMEQDLYERKTVSVELHRDGQLGQIEAEVYLAPDGIGADFYTPAADAEEGTTSEEYLTRMIVGAESHRMPKSCIDEIRRTASIKKRNQD